MNENVFSNKADVYMKFRPSYALGAIQVICNEIHIGPETVIADIGAGTGIFTGQLLELGCRVIAVEPNTDMRSKIAVTAPGAEIISAPAEHTGIPAGSVSLITAAESFHWFQPDEFRAECRRVLQPAGKVMLVWNLTDKTTDTVQQLHELNMRYCDKYRAIFADGRQLAEDRFVQISKDFLGNVKSFSFKNDLCYSMEQFVGNRVSSSYAPKPGDSEYDSYCAALRDFFEQKQHDGFVKIPNNTVCFIGTV